MKMLTRVTFIRNSPRRDKAGASEDQESPPI